MAAIPHPTVEPEPEALPTATSELERRIASGLAFLRRRLTGDYEVDEFGYDEELTENVLLGMFRPLYERYFRVETRGLDRVPDKGGVLIVANHSGTLPMDAIMTQIALADHHPARRHLRMLAADVVFTMPFMGELARKAGHTLACNPDAERLLNSSPTYSVVFKPWHFCGSAAQAGRRH